MSTLLSRMDQAISITDIARSAKKIFDKLKSGEQDRYVVMRNNAPEAVVIAAKEYEAIMQELDDLRIDAIAYNRLASIDENTKFISHEEMLARYGS